MSAADLEASFPAVRIESWTPEVEMDTDALVMHTVYVLPTRTVVVDELPVTVFDDSVRFLPKYARAAGAEVQFAPIPGDRRFVSEYSHDPGVWELALTCYGFLNDWLIMAVTAWITSRCQVTGLSESEALEREMELEIAEWKPKKGKFVGLRVKGRGSDVIDAIRELRALDD
ncbi:hypothetical protein BKA24_002537 [Microbacterium marinum]|uniref:Uncharacterized protein n=1 Tax=Microbacterium marinum TaxID=421115 RepID=A0A7W7BS42_9MICO|nr:hypothetical protein [Microbacterium marinum]MBB4667828.1 hypothetical protein [Microbacterium marinum]